MASPNPAPTPKPPKPGLLEQLGVRYWHLMAVRRKPHKPMNLTDDQMVRRADWIAAVGIFWCFVAGALSAFGSVFADEEIPDSVGEWTKFGWVMGITVVLTAIEFLVLFWLGLRTVFYLSRASGIDLLMNHSTEQIQAQFPNIMARAAMEVPDPVQKYLGIDPLSKVNKTQLLVVGLLYKVKVFLTNFTARTLLKFVVGKSVIRVSVAYIAVPITGMWNAIVMGLIIREARLRIFGALLVDQVVNEFARSGILQTMQPATRECIIRAVANTVVLTQKYHPNMIILIVRVHQLLGEPPIDNPDDWELLIRMMNDLPPGERLYVMDMLAVAAALDGRVSKLEHTRLTEAFQEHTDKYMLRIRALSKALRRGRIQEVRRLADLESIAD
jgi:hypothetical protein